MLLRAKAQCGHGQWLTWLKKNVQFDVRRVQRYMEWAKYDVTSYLPIEEQEDEWRRISGNAEKEPGVADHQATAQEDAPTNWVDKQCESIDWYTPRSLLDRVEVYFAGPIPLDPATAPSNPTRATRFFTKEQDGLVQEWRGTGVFVNPPYGEELPSWTAKVHHEAANGIVIVALLPCGARFSTGYWQDHILNSCLGGICFVRGRVAFEDEHGNSQKGNPYDSAIYGFNIDRDRFLSAFGVLGKVLIVKEAHE